MNNQQEYIEIYIPGTLEQFEIISAILEPMNYEGFVEQEDSLQVYISADIYNREELLETLRTYGLSTDIKENTIAPQNWNAMWESSFQPVPIADKVYIRAPFHQAEPGFIYDLIVQPKMSFGTGHHDTTAQVMELMLNMDFNGKRVFDYGCGTGILSVLASQLGATYIFANDIDDWAFENVAENLNLNHITNVDYKQGDISLVAGKTFDIILANINRNILLASFEQMSAVLINGGECIISGFYEDDIEVLMEEAFKHKLLEKQRKSSVRGWTAMILIKG